MTKESQEVSVNLRRTLIPIFIVTAIIIIAVVLLLQENIGGIVTALQNANYLFILLAFIIYFSSAFFWAARWRIGLFALGKNASMRNLFPIIWGSMFINNMTPLNRAGGDPIGRPYLLKKTSGIRFRMGFASVVAEQLFQIPVVLFLLAMGLILRVQMTANPGLVSIATVVISLSLAIVLVPFFILLFGKKEFSSKITGFLTKILKFFRREADPTKILKTVEDFRVSARKIINSKHNAAWMMGFSAALWILDLVRISLILYALGINISLPMLFLASTLPQIAGLVPLLPGGIGAVEVTMVSVFMWFGVSPVLALSATLIERSMSFVFSTLIGAGALSYLGIKIWTKS
ncbi:hypothetical protein AKJ35_00435 [candidate division MSBL1 archaeon SCGC-AAA833F18]|nr:hypothetical protein AKJ42_02725 [candidate division MSBL1 archaeon SCGC-AAA261C02]KXB01867.1 hypothetical protein AKJ44_02000 [candidate division MSBL1 archaeon SCGC-AAA261F17]KXB04646.1 hypothetical protein AKJ48_01880 [candidate division MSBL1 archaeon SCGC-AAA261O19]KXB09299.1 hypothetical protein AKJ46_00600 [candidate division MSBL1 archaeon SCGC-AAA833K04]KXB09612.1 hypothetical protein AKJ35_00435 [candidate division MSBL1 archaeon SCGC-AAA833F18]